MAFIRKVFFQQRFLRCRTRAIAHHQQLLRPFSTQPLSSLSLFDYHHFHGSSSIESLLDYYATIDPTPTSLDTLMRLGSTQQHQQPMLAMAELLRQELPVRLAHRIHDLDRIVAGLRDTPAVQSVRAIYVQSLLELTDQFPEPIDDDPAVEERFARVLGELYRNHANVLVDMARGAYQFRAQQQQQQHYADDLLLLQQECHQFLDRFYMSRIGIRFLAGQYLALRQQQQQQQHHNTTSTSPPALVGMIDRATRPDTYIRQAARDASLLCRQTFGGRCPRIEIVGNTTLTFPYIPTYLHYVVLELLKNAVRATMEARTTTSAALPPVRVMVADGTEDVAMKVSDQGGGIPRSQVNNIWSYLFTTASPHVQEQFLSTTTKMSSPAVSPLAGLGYGLPLSRNYCRYFGGDLDIMSMEGYGTDAFIHLKQLGDAAPVL